MQIRRFPLALLSTLTVLAVALIPSWQAAASSAADGQWRLTLELSSFHEGHIASFDEIVEIRAGHFDGSFSDGYASVALTFWIAGDAVRGNMAVDAGRNWNWVTIKYDGPLVDGVFFRELVGFATYEVAVPFRRKHDNRVNRDVDVVMRLQRQ